ncbi:ATP-binding protein [Methanococcoides sp. SA1]|nr:ATP-binding protein [Methanococcoides sp. SA1]
MKQKEQIFELSKELRLPTIRKNFTQYIETACHENLDYASFLTNILVSEYEQRKLNRRKSSIRRANFPYKKYLEDLNVNNLPVDGQKKLKALKSLSFLETGQNVILAGNPGTGKTHMAIGLGIKACLEGYKVLFTNVSSLITQLKESRSERVLRNMENSFEKYDLVICDEFGYISFDKEGGELLFSHLSLRTERKSTIITTNLTFDRWNELLGDPVLTTALIDRLTHKAYIVNMNGNSFRANETKIWMQNSK